MIERYYRELLSHFSRRTRSAENAADIVQEAVSYTHQTLPTNREV